MKYNNSMTKNAQTYWYKRRRYGWGWVPVAWQGWATLAGCLGGILIAAVVLLDDEPRNTWTGNSWEFLGVAAILVLLILLSCYVRGPKPKWRWGKKPSDNPDEDF